MADPATITYTWEEDGERVHLEPGDYRVLLHHNGILPDFEVRTTDILLAVRGGIYLHVYYDEDIEALASGRGRLDEREGMWIDPARLTPTEAADLFLAKGLPVPPELRPLAYGRPFIEKAEGGDRPGPGEWDGPADEPPPPCSVEIGEPGEPVFVCGVEKPPLTDKQYAVVKAVRDRYQNGLTTAELSTLPDVDAVSVLRHLRDSDPDWAEAIKRPGPRRGTKSVGNRRVYRFAPMTGRNARNARSTPDFSQEPS